MTNSERIRIPATRWYSFLFPKSAYNNFTENVILNSSWSTKPYPSHCSVGTLSPHLQDPTHTLQQIQGLFGVKPLPSFLGVAHGLPEFPLCESRPSVTKQLSRQRKGDPPAAEVPRTLTAGDVNSTKPSSGLHSAATKLPLAMSGEGASRSARAVPGLRPPGPARPSPSHRRSTRSSASSCHSSWRHRRSRSAWASEPSGRKSLGP